MWEFPHHLLAADQLTLNISKEFPLRDRNLSFFRLEAGQNRICIRIQAESTGIGGDLPLQIFCKLLRNDLRRQFQLKRTFANMCKQIGGREMLFASVTDFTKLVKSLLFFIRRRIRHPLFEQNGESAGRVFGNRIVPECLIDQTQNSAQTGTAMNGVCADCL